MTPQLTPQPNLTGATDSTTHLTSEQFAELLDRPAQAAGSSPTLAEAHLLGCQECTAELASLREALSFFREASSAYAESELKRIPKVTLPTRSRLFPLVQPAYWAVAIAMLLVAVIPMQLHRQQPLRPATVATEEVAAASTQSDEALLEDVNRELSTSVPTPMQSLADPTATASSSSTDTSIPASAQRKN